MLIAFVETFSDGQWTGDGCWSSAWGMDAGAVPGG